MDTECFLTTPLFCLTSSLLGLESPSFGGTGVESAKLDDLRSEESILSIVFALVVDPPASLGKYSLVEGFDGAGTAVLGEMPSVGLTTDGSVSMFQAVSRFGCGRRSFGIESRCIGQSRTTSTEREGFNNAKTATQCSSVVGVWGG